MYILFILTIPYVVNAFICPHCTFNSLNEYNCWNDNVCNQGELCQIKVIHRHRGDGEVTSKCLDRKDKSCYDKNQCYAPQMDERGCFICCEDQECVNKTGYQIAESTSPVPQTGRNSSSMTLISTPQQLTSTVATMKSSTDATVTTTTEKTTSILKSTKQQHTSTVIPSMETTDAQVNTKMSSTSILKSTKQQHTSTVKPLMETTGELTSQRKISLLG